MQSWVAYTLAQNKEIPKTNSTEGSDTQDLSLPGALLSQLQTEKDDPQPHVVAALGLRIINWAPDRSSL